VAGHLIDSRECTIKGFSYVDAETLSSDYNCPICLLPFMEPVDVSCCRATMCTKCCQRLSACPLCRATTASMQPSSRLIQNTVDALMVSCNACREVMQRELFPKHAKTSCMESTNQEALPFIVARLRRDLDAKLAAIELRPARAFLVTEATFVRRIDSIADLRGALEVAPEFRPEYRYGTGAIPAASKFESHMYQNAQSTPSCRWYLRGDDSSTGAGRVLKPMEVLMLPEGFRPSTPVQTRVKLMSSDHEGRNIRKCESKGTMVLQPDGRVELDSDTTKMMFQYALHRSSLTCWMQAAHDGKNHTGKCTSSSNTSDIFGLMWRSWWLQSSQYVFLRVPTTTCPLSLLSPGTSQTAPKMKDCVEMSQSSRLQIFHSIVINTSILDWWSIDQLLIDHNASFSLRARELLPNFAIIHSDLSALL